MNTEADQFLVYRPFDDAKVKHALEHLGKQGQNINMHYLILPGV
jgi:hypothetical protein